MVQPPMLIRPAATALSSSRTEILLDTDVSLSPRVRQCGCIGQEGWNTLSISALLSTVVAHARTFTLCNILTVRRLLGMAGAAEPSGSWEQMWSRGVGVGEFFDATKSSPALSSAISRGWFTNESDGTPMGPALVPGCGRGYDVATLAKAVGSATGIELSATAQATATKYLAGERMAVEQGPQPT